MNAKTIAFFVLFLFSAIFAACSTTAGNPYLSWDRVECSIPLGSDSSNAITVPGIFGYLWYSKFTNGNSMNATIIIEDESGNVVVNGTSPTASYYSNRTMNYGVFGSMRIYAYYDGSTLNTTSTDSDALTGMSGTHTFTPTYYFGESATNATLEVTYTQGVANATTTNTTALTNASGQRNLTVRSDFTNTSAINSVLTVVYSPAENYTSITNATDLANASGDVNVALNSLWKNSSGTTASAVISYQQAINYSNATNTTTLADANSTALLPINSLFINSVAYNASLVITYESNTSIETNVSINGYALGTFDNTTPDTFVVPQTYLAASNNITFSSNGTGTNITAIELDYYMNDAIVVSVNGNSLGTLDGTSTDTFAFTQEKLATSTNFTFTSQSIGSNITNIVLSYYTTDQINVSVNGNAVATLDGTSPDAINVEQDYLTANTNVTFASQSIGSNITNLSLAYVFNATVTVDINGYSTSFGPSDASPVSLSFNQSYLDNPLSVTYTPNFANNGSITTATLTYHPYTQDIKAIIVSRR